MSIPNAFSVAQPQYAALGIATFPVRMTDGTKVPAVKGWQRIGEAGSEKLVSGFPHAEMLGFCPGSRSKVTVLDIVSIPNAFSVAQPQYAALGIATFPVRMTDGTKVPAVKGWQRIGEAGSEKLVSGFPHAEMLGFCPNSRSKVTVLDIDSTDERLLADAVSRHGQTPLIVKTAGKKFHAYYRHAGERRLVRPFQDQPIDLLGGGFVVAPPSVALDRERYQIIQGRLEDILDLPPMRGVDDLKTAEKQITARTRNGDRNKRLFSFSLRAAKMVGNAEELYARASSENATYLPPLEDGEVLKTVKSAWRFETEGQNWVGCGGMVGLTFDQVDRLATQDGDAFRLLAVLKRHHIGKSEFALANATAAKFGWGRNHFRIARKRLEEMREIRCLHSGGRSDNDPPIYAWADQGGVQTRPQY